jgi:hypothetical protein
MKTPALLRTLTPWGWALAAAGVLAAALIGLHGLGFRWDPFGQAERRLRSAEAEASAAVADAAARRLEIEGAVEQARRLEDLHQQTVAVARETARAATQARSAHDADTPLDPDRRARLAGHDRELCRLAPAVCGTAAAGPAGGGDQTLRAGAIAGGTDNRRS